MPYISQTMRQLLQSGLAPGNAGELNYAMTKQLVADNQPEKRRLKAIKDLIYQYWDEYGPNYQVINDIVGAVVCAVYEYKARRGSCIMADEIYKILDTFYRNVARPYEDGKIKENGDVY